MPVPGRVGGLDACRGGVIGRVDFAAQPEGRDAPDELPPIFETILAGDDELRIGEPKGREAYGLQRLLIEAGMMPRDAIERRRFGLGVEKILGLFLVLFEVGLVG